LPDGLFHATARGVAKMPIYRDDDDRLVFLGLLATATEGFEWTCHAFCLMTNHYHLVLDATRENLSDGFQVLNGCYAQGFNGKYKRWGPCLRGAILVPVARRRRAPEHLSLRHGEPVRAGLCERVSDWPWSACRYDLG
jgi:putative transposase